MYPPFFQDIDILALIQCLASASDRIMDVYHSPSIEIITKDDKSPVTNADLASQFIINEYLQKTYPDIPVISEETENLSYDVRKNWSNVWILDPLDGTKEFLQKSDQFSINLALIHLNEPILGMIYLPAYNEVYIGLKNYGSFKISNGETSKITVSRFDIDQPNLRVLVSRTHLDLETGKQIERLNQPIISSLGSALKFLAIADGRADYYPRLQHIMEWDIAAGQVIIEAAGGSILEFGTKRPLTYNKLSLWSPFFVAMGECKNNQIEKNV